MGLLMIFVSALVTAYVQHSLSLGPSVWIAWTLCALWALWFGMVQASTRHAMLEQVKLQTALLADMRAMMAGSTPPSYVRDPIPGDPMREKK